MVSFLKKLTGIGGGSNSDDYYEDEEQYTQDEIMNSESDEYGLDDTIEEVTDISIDIDMYEDSDNLYLRTFIAGVNPKELDIDVTRDVITVSGERYDFEERDEDQFLQMELSWGKFQRRVSLPKEIDIEEIEASIKYGVLTLKLPKLDKDRKIRVRL